MITVTIGEKVFQVDDEILLFVLVRAANKLSEEKKEHESMSAYNDLTQSTKDFYEDYLYVPLRLTNDLIKEVKERIANAGPS